jgi:hypothetical protein
MVITFELGVNGSPRVQIGELDGDKLIQNSHLLHHCLGRLYICPETGRVVQVK